MANNIQLYPITHVASKWRDLDVKDQKWELVLKISFFAAILIVLVGTVLGIYYSATTVDTFVNRLGIQVTYSNAPFSIIPGILGPAAIAGLITFGVCFTNFDENQNSFSENLSREGAHEALVQLLTEQDLQQVYNRYYRKNGGLRQLVRKGYLLAEQGDQLRGLFAKYTINRQLMRRYEGQVHIARAISAHREPLDYRQAKQEIASLEFAWRTMQAEIKAQYADSIEIHYPPAAPEDQVNETLSFRLLTPTHEALNWSDLTASERKQEKILSIGSVALILIVLTGMTLAIYFCMTTTHFHSSIGSGKSIQLIHSNAFMSVIPIVPGTGFIVAIIIFSIMHKLDKIRDEELDKPYIRDDRILLLSEGSIDEVYRHYYKRNGGLGPLIRAGFLSIEQRNRLHVLFKQVHQNTHALDAYTVYPDAFTAELQVHPENSAEFTKLQAERLTLLQEWSELRADIKKNFYFPYSLEVLPPEILQQVLNFLSVQDIGRVGRINQYLNTQAQAALDLRAKEYGSETNQPSKVFLDTLFKAIVVLAKKGCIPEKYIQYRVKGSFKIVDAEATLRQIQRASPADKELKLKLNKGMIYYANNGNVEMIKILLAFGADLDARSKDRGGTPLHIAAEKDDLQLVEFLLEQGADPNALNYNSSSPLILATWYANSIEVMQTLLKNGAALSINHRSRTGQTALHYAARDNNIQRVRLLLEAGANPRIPNSYNQFARQLTTRQEIRDLLV